MRLSSWILLGQVVFLMAHAEVQAQHEMHSVGFRLAELVTIDGDFAQGTTFIVDVLEDQSDQPMREGVIDGLLREGMRVVGETAGSGAQVRLTLIPRGRVDGDVRISVAGTRLEDGAYVLSRAYLIPFHEKGLIESLLAPVVAISAAVLVVYLLLTVRSS